MRDIDGDRDKKHEIEIFRCGAKSTLGDALHVPHTHEWHGEQPDPPEHGMKDRERHADGAPVLRCHVEKTRSKT